MTRLATDFRALMNSSHRRCKGIRGELLLLVDLIEMEYFRFLISMKIFLAGNGSLFWKMIKSRWRKSIFCMGRFPGRTTCDGGKWSSIYRSTWRVFKSPGTPDERNARTTVAAKTATATAKAAQAGQYNYARCMRRGDTTAASFALWEFLREAVHIEYLLHHTYMPYYKWAWRGMGNLSGAQEMQKRIEILANERPERDHWKAVGEVQEVNWDDPIVCQIEQISAMILERLREQKLTYGWEDFLEIHTERILKAGERMKREKTEILEAIIQLEWNMFQKVRNTGGRAGCQDDWETFYIMRKSQFTSWKKELLLSYERDLLDGESAGRNLVMEKYAYMMELTVPEEYRRIAENLPKISEEKKKLIEGIVSIQVSWREEMAGEYPQLSGQARIIHTEEDTAEDISFETYLRGELKTYSMETLVRYGQLVAEYAKAGKNMVEEIIECTVRLYGYGTMGQAEHSVGRKK